VRFGRTGWSVSSLVTALLAAALWNTACGSDSPPSSPNAPTTPAARSISSLTIAGPAFDAPVLPDQTRQYTATAQYSDGTSQDLTASATWASSNESIATVASGAVKAVGSGDVTITARITTVTPAAEGTLKLSFAMAPAIVVTGIVREAPPNSGRPVADARVEVIGAGNVTRTATTDAAGGYTVSGVRAPFSIRVTKDGYDPLEQRVDAAAADVRLELGLVECCGRGGGRTAEHNFDHNFDQSDRALDPQTKSYTFEVGRRGTFEAALNRTGCSYNAYYGVGLELWRDGVKVARSAGSSPSDCSPRINTQVEAGRYELRAIGAWAWGCCPYHLTVRHPE
jgi:Carboxypeptidase regulatory-like domain/Bacterial Ig-like domain (group 2)